ncbi:MAG: Spy/CpxP family protein refolding chaperone [Chitinispirillaceae bacterium]|nr:Spy/CpxP family protein refolding chaperone [Chitinispirillaceae bacterium]
MKMKRALLPVVIAALFLSSTGPAQAGSEPGNGPGAGKSNRPHHRWAELNLTEEQKGKLKTLHEEMQPVREKHMEAVKTVREKIKAELLKTDPSQNTLYGYAGELGELHKQMSKDQGDHFLKIKKVLTPEQFAQLVEKDGGMMGRGKDFRPGKGGAGPRKGKACPHKGVTCPHKSDTLRKGDRPHGGGAPESEE